MKMLQTLLNVILVALFLLMRTVKLDIPVHCPRDKIDGQWIFRINKEVFLPSLTDPKTTCTHGIPDKVSTVIGDKDFRFNDYYELKLSLRSDYKVYSNFKEVGKWTPVYDEGFILSCF